MDAQGLLEFARSLASQAAGQPCVGITAGPASFRTATSRAYYAAYTAGSQFLREVARCEVPRTPQAHAVVFQLLRSCPLWELRDAARDLGTLRDQRNRADYDLADLSMETQGPAQDAITRAEATLEVLRPYLVGEQRLPPLVEQALQAHAARLTRDIRDGGE